jgi:hypothetical protein
MLAAVSVVLVSRQRSVAQSAAGRRRAAIGAGLDGAIVGTDESRRLPGLLRTTAVDPKQPCRGFRQPLPAGLDRTFGMQFGI